MVRIKKILAPTDLMESSLAGIKYGISLARDHDAEVVVVHVADDTLMPRIGMTPYQAEMLTRRRWAVVGEGILSLIEEERRKKDLLLDDFLTRHIEPEVLRSAKLKRVTRLGEVVAEIVSVAAGEECDLIVMASRGRGWLGRMVFGSLSEKVARRAPCPVLTIQPSALVREDGRRVPVSSLVLKEEHIVH
jgi:nucleotide-binding universal stress UspA family protein